MPEFVYYTAPAGYAYPIPRFSPFTGTGLPDFLHLRQQLADAFHDPVLGDEDGVGGHVQLLGYVNYLPWSVTDDF